MTTSPALAATFVGSRVARSGDYLTGVSGVVATQIGDSIRVLWPWGEGWTFTDQVVRLP
jgi:hypothetical protein